MSTETEGPNKLAMRKAMCYIPFAAIIFFIIEKDNKDLEQHIRYGLLLFAFWVVAGMIFRLLGMWFFVFMIYVAGSGYLAFKAYSGEEIKVDFLDQAWEAITGKIKK